MTQFLSLASQLQTKNPNTEFFKQIMRDCGIKLTPRDDPNVLTQEQALVVRDIEKFLGDAEDNVGQFVKGFKVLIKKEKYLKKALLPTLFKKSGSSQDEVEIQQESLFRIFLKINTLQQEIISILVDELTSTVSDEQHETAHLRLLLGQLRYLPHIKNAQELTTKLLDIIEIAPFASKIDILESLPEIIPDSEANNTADQLSKLLETNDALAMAIIDCLNALNISSEIRTQIQKHILAKIVTGTSTKSFPIFLQFLLNDINAKTLPGTLMKIRNSLNVMMGTNDKTDIDSAKLLIFEQLKKSKVSKAVSESWLTVITNIKTHNDHKPIDLIILFMLHSESKVKKRTIETIFRKRIKDAQFTSNLLEQLFQKYFPLQLMRNYLKTMLEIGSSLLRLPEQKITDFANSLYRLLYKTLDKTSKQEVLENLVLVLGTTDKNVTPILNILIDLLEHIPPNHTTILMRLLDKILSFELSDVKLLFEILCTLTCRSEALDNLKSELHILIRKYLSSAKPALKHIGIVAAVTMVKHMTINADSDIVLSEDLSVDQLQNSCKEAANILELTKVSTQRSNALIGLYYDQLASVLYTADIDRAFVAWLNENITDDFQTKYVTEAVCEDSDLQLSMQFNLNEASEIDVELAVNIAELTFRNEILTLAPHFRLLRLLHFRQQNGDLSSISALLGCGVVLPQLEERDNLGLEQLRKLTDCLFHCINWFREAISAFVGQKPQHLKLKVIQRIEHLKDLEEIFFECLDNLPGHKFPSSYFDSNAPTSPCKEPMRKKPKISHSVAFREIDTDIIKLLKYPLQSDEQTTLTLKQFNYILKDFVRKLGLILANKHLGLLHLGTVKPLALIKDCQMVLPNINSSLKFVMKLDNEQAKEAFTLILQFLSVIFTWSGWQQCLNLLRDFLKELSDETNNQSVNNLTIDVINSLSNYAEHCHSVANANDLIKTMETLHSLHPNVQMRSKIAKTAAFLLNKDLEGHSSIESLIESYLSSANLKALSGIVATLQGEAATLKSKSDTLAMLRNVTKSNFYVLYRQIWITLHERVKLEVEAATNAQHLAIWKSTALTMQALMTIVKVQDSRMNLVCFLKKSIAILKVFLSHGIPILEIELRHEPDQVVDILKTIQGTTRFLHHLSCHAKVTKDVSLMAHGPQVRLTLESLIYRVKAALVGNGCSDAFWMGNLKNRNLHGEDILSQSTQNSTQIEDEVMPSDDDELLDDDDGGRGVSSGSEVFP